MTDLAWMTIAEAAGLIRAGKLSPVEYASALLDRVAAYDSAINAFITVTRDIALAEARQAEAEIAAGNWRGPMHGIPYGLKDIIDYAGQRTTASSAVLLDNVATSDAFATAKLKAAGAVLLGKLTTQEFATGAPRFDLPFPPARNPWNGAHHPGGSSNGSGAAVAAGFVPAALGTDTGGSIRNPASQCAIVGLKATYGRVSRRGVLPAAFSLDHLGPMTRTVRDNAMLLQVIAGHDPQDPGSADEPVPDFSADIEKGVKGLKIGVIRHFYDKDEIARADMGDSVEAGIKMLESLGATIVELKVSPLQRYLQPLTIISHAESAAVQEQGMREHPEKYGAFARSRYMIGLGYRAVDYVQATRLRLQLQAEMNAAMAGVDAVVTASSHEPACRIDDWDEVVRTYIKSARGPFNLTGHPALALPTGFSAEGLPLAMQVAGKAFDEATVLRVAHAYEQAAGWHTMHPTLSPLLEAAAQ